MARPTARSPGTLAAAALAALLARGPRAPRAACEDPLSDPAAAPFARAPDPSTATGPDAELFRDALELSARGRWREARRRLWRLLDEYPASPFAAEAADRSGDRDGGNAFLGLSPMGPLGPSARRIDVALMGDGYLFDRQDVYDKHAQAELDLLLREPVYAAYRPYFNFWRFNLASRHTGVDETPPPADPEEEERRARRPVRPRAGPRTFDTALDCKAAGPQGQVMANPGRVFHYLGYLDVHDGLAIVFAQKGVLGMGGGGIATTGPRGVVVHEFGHAFGWLLDEYAVNPEPPSGFVEAANATTRRERPPWQHFLDARVPRVGVFEGGATFQKGVFRPAASCAMNTGGGDPYCPVCREQVVRVLYTYLSPIDEAWPAARELERGPQGWPELRVVPQAPASHALEVTWFLGPAPATTAPPEADPGSGPEDDLTPEERRLRRRQAERGEPPPAAPAPPPAGGGAAPDPLPDLLPRKEGQVRRSRGTGRDPPPPGRALGSTRERLEGPNRFASRPTLPDLPPGRHLLTAVVRDPTRIRGERFPWVLKDEAGLLEDRVAWVLVVR